MLNTSEGYTKWHCLTLFLKLTRVTLFWTDALTPDIELNALQQHLAFHFRLANHQVAVIKARVGQLNVCQKQRAVALLQHLHRHVNSARVVLALKLVRPHALKDRLRHAQPLYVGRGWRLRRGEQAGQHCRLTHTTWSGDRTMDEPEGACKTEAGGYILSIYFTLLTQLETF